MGSGVEGSIEDCQKCVKDKEKALMDEKKKRSWDLVGVLFLLVVIPLAFCWYAWTDRWTGGQGVIAVPLIAVSIAAVLFFILWGRREKEHLKQKNRELRYVIDGVDTLFSRFVMADLEKGTYQYLAGTTPERTEFSDHGQYKDLADYLCSFLANEEDRERFTRLFDVQAVVEEFDREDSDLRFEYHVRRNGREEWEHMSIVCLERKGGKATKVLYLRQNITEIKEKELKIQEELALASEKERQYRKELEAQTEVLEEQTKVLEEALLQAQHANNAKTTFLSNMSHDIRTPMNAIIGFATIAVNHIDNKLQVKDCLEKVLSSSNHLLSLINDILDMSRIESGKVQIKEQECDLSTLLHDLVSIIQPQVKAKQLSLFIDTFDVVNEDVIADPLKLNQVFVNLMSNAVKYTPAGGRIDLGVAQKASIKRGYGEYIFTIRDKGIGMSPEFVEHIFEPFERELSTTKAGIQGTGLGMAITKNIVDMMGGQISVKSEKGQGSEFTVRLFLRLQDAKKLERKAMELEGLRALVVDDDLAVCDSVSKMLTRFGMRSEWTISGREAVHRAKSALEQGDAFQTYIIDWQMPELSGIETVRQIRKAVGKDVPIVILTAYDWSDIEEEAREMGIDVFCAKPLFMSDLGSALLLANHLGEREEAPAWTQADFGGKRVLVVEDNELNREIAEEILTEAGFVVETAPDGTDAVAMMEKAEEGYFDAILMDVQMPVMDGYEATRTIRALPRADVHTLPIIAMTANAMEEDKEAALKNGMNAHIAKPIDMEVFMGVLDHYLR